jgi:hypothetical protein
VRALLFSLLLFADVLTNADIVKLVKAGLSPATIEAKIATSATKFDTSTDSLVALTKAGVPDRVIKSMIERKPAPPPAPPAPPPAVAAPRPPASAPPAPPPPGKAVVRRYDVAIHRDENARCSGGELRIDGKGVSGSRCKELDFTVEWKDVTRICVIYGFRGTIVITTGKGTHRLSTETPAEAKRIIDTMESVSSTLKSKKGC